jgi:hypothetical protein
MPQLSVKQVLGAFGFDRALPSFAQGFAEKPEPLSNKRAPSNTAGYIRKKLSTPLWSWTSRRTAKHMATMIAVVP